MTEDIQDIDLEERAKEILRDIGAGDISSGEGTIDIPDLREGSRVVSYDIKDTTPAWLLSRPRVPGMLLDRIDSSMSAGILAGHDILKKPCIQYKNPNILYALIPVRLTNLKYHAFSFRLDGDITNKFENKGTEGQKGTTTRWRWQDCPADPTDYSWQLVPGSADLSSSWGHDIKESQTGAALGKVNQSTNAKIGQSSSIAAHWTSGNLIDLILQVISLILTGGITTRNGYDVSYSYSWQGTQTKTAHIDATVWIPVQGGLVWCWD